MSWPRPAPLFPPSQVPKELQTKMMGYFDHKYPDEKVINSAAVLEDLPPPLMALFMHHDVIKVCPLLRNAPRAVSTSIVRHGKLTSGAVGDVLIRAGESPRDIYFMKNGTCDVFMMENSSEQTANTVDGHYKTVKVDQVQTGDIFGDTAVLQMAASNITITCTTDVEFLIVPRQDFLNALSDHPEARAAQARPWPAGSN